jgi:carboxymethylenebutenolidase
MNTKQTSILLAIIAILGFAVWYAYGSGGVEGIKEANVSQGTATTTVKNVDTMTGTSTMPIVGFEDVEYFTGAKGYFVRPDSEGDFPGVVMIHENRGLRPEIKEAADALAKEGYMVLAVDLLGGTAEDQTGARALTAKFDQKTGTANMREAVEYLKMQGAGKIASLGWCFGGKQSVELAISGEKLDATVVYYGGGVASTTAALAPIKWPVLGIFGDQDQVIPIATVNAFESALDELGVTNEVYIYPGVGHAFANPSGANYAPAETADAWRKTLDFLAENLR